MRSQEPALGKELTLLVSIPRVALKLGVDHKTLRLAVSRGELPAYRIGSNIRLKWTDVDAWLESKVIPTSRPTRNRRQAVA
jgi:excisionase family DNA binding protein